MTNPNYKTLLKKKEQSKKIESDMNILLREKYISNSPLARELYSMNS